MDGRKPRPERGMVGSAVGVIELVLQIALGIALTAWVVRRDMRRLPPALYVRSWNEASFWNAVVAFQPWSILVHFVRTRRSVWGLVLGVFWTVLVLVLIWLVVAGIDWVVEVFA
jgi:hypothetical protein